MAITRHVYETYIKATPERVWEAITDPDVTRRYFHGTAFTAESVTAGSPFSYAFDDGRSAVLGEIVEVEPLRRLVVTWSFQYAPELAAEPPSRVEWELTPAGEGITRLTVRHVDLARSPITWASVRLGWVGILDNLKTLVETGEALGEIDDPAAESAAESAAGATDVDGDWHRAQAVAANNATWDFLGIAHAERTAHDSEQMVRHAYAAAFHWERARGAAPANAARSDWLLSRVWAVRGIGDLALHHASRCAEACAEHGLADFDLAYAHESRARALACLGRLDEAGASLAAARAVPIADAEDAAIVADDLAAEPWYGLAV